MKYLFMMSQDLILVSANETAKCFTILMFKIKFRRVINVPGSYNGGGSFYYSHFLTDNNNKFYIYTHTHTCICIHRHREIKSRQKVLDLILGEGITFVEVHIYWSHPEGVYRATDGLLSFQNMEISIYHQIWCILNHYFLNFLCPLFSLS